MNKMQRRLRLLFWMIAISWSGIATAQQFELKGKLIDENKLPIEFITVSLLKNNTLSVAQSITDSLGLFSIKAEAGNYILLLEEFGTALLNKDIMLVENRDLGEIELNESIELGGVLITARNKLIERKIDRLVFNVKNSIMSDTGDFLDVLNASPGVRVDARGAIEAMGKGAVLYIDGKIIKLSGNDLSGLLKGKLSNEIDKIEIYTNPPAKFEAEGAAVINIITNRKTISGYDIMVRNDYKLGTFAKYSPGIAVNYKNKKWNLSTNYSNNRGRSLTKTKDYIHYTDRDNPSNWYSDEESLGKYNLHNYKLAVDYELNEKDIIGFQFDGTNTKNNVRGKTETDIYNQLDTKDSMLYSSNRMFPSNNLVSGNLNYRKILNDSLDKSFNVNFDYTYSRSNLRKNTSTHSLSQSGEIMHHLIDFHEKTERKINLFSSKIDYSHPLSAHSGFDLGYKYSIIRNENELEHWNRENEESIFSSLKSNTFIYKEQNHAVYLSFRDAFLKKFTYQIGLRAEYTLTDGNSKTNGQRTKRDYLELFPTGYIQYEIDKNHKLNLNYGRRISRPDYWRLNPFRRYITSNSYYEGNPYLRPSFTHDIALSYDLKSKYYFTLYYTQTDGIFTNITEQDYSTNTLANKQVNLDRQVDYGIKVMASLNLRNWYEVSFFSQFSVKKESSNYLGSSFNNSLLWFYTSINNSFVLSTDKTWKGEINLKYATKGIQGIYRLGSTFDLSAALRKSFGKRWNASVSISDIFYKTYYRIDVNYLNQKNGFVEKNDTRILSFSLSYRIERNKSESVKSREKEEERNRIGI